MPPRKVLMAAGGIALLALILVFKPKPLAGPERAAALMVDAATAAIEAGDIDQAMDLVASDVHIQMPGLGQIGKRELARYLTRLSLLGGGISITIVSQDIEVAADGRSVEIAISAALVAGGIRGALDDNAGLRDIVIVIGIVDGDWQIVSARG